jgi:hypothetical protein
MSNTDDINPGDSRVPDTHPFSYESEVPTACRRKTWQDIPRSQWHLWMSETIEHNGMFLMTNYVVPIPAKKEGQQ